MGRRESAFQALANLIVPAECAGCGVPDSTVCRQCRVAVQSCLWAGGPRPCVPEPCPPGLPLVTASGRYEGVLAALVAAYKDRDRRDCAAVLGALLASAVTVALSRRPGLPQALARGEGPLLVVPVPSSRRSRRVRGDAPLQELARRAVGSFHPQELVVSSVLVPRRRVRDQAGLGAQARRENLADALEVRRRGRPPVNTPCLLVDDVMTTGATLSEAARALGAAGLEVVGAATICATQRRVRGHSQPSAGSR